MIVLLIATAACVALTGCGKPDAMAYCRGLEERDLARDCKKDTSVERSNAAIFKVRDGSEGRVLVTNDDDYMATLNGPVGPHPGWNEQEKKGDIYLAARRGSGKPNVEDAVLIWFPPTLDVFDRDAVSSFMTRDMDEIAKGKPLAKREVRGEHPIRVPSCHKENMCLGAGLCAVMPNTTNCIAAFDQDCRKSNNCKKDGLCRADTQTGLCTK